MKVHFWGVRGSLPSPLSSEQVQSKINAVVQRIQAKDLESPDARERFIASLPPEIYGTVGGNTSCVQLTTKSGECFVFDAGTGIRAMARAARHPKGNRYSLFLSHLHWDHIQGFPFFDALYDKRITIDVYTPFDRAEEFFSKQMSAPFFPVDYGSVRQRIRFRRVTPGKEFFVSGARISCCRMNHPGDSFSYAVDESGRRFVYATDIELTLDSFLGDADVKKVFSGADAVVLDSQYTPTEAVSKSKWGHSAYSHCVDFAAAFNIKRIYLFHHEPCHDDRQLESILQAARNYAKFVSPVPVQVNMALEGGEFVV